MTGGTGLLGRHLVAALRAAGDDVRLLVREGTPAPDGCEIVRGDVGDAVAMRRALRSVRAVYHLAAITPKWLRQPAAFERINVAAAVDLARLASEASVERIVHVSSFTVLGPSPSGGGPDGKLVEEHTVGSPAALQNDYQRSKHRAHMLLTDLAARGEAPVVLVCPGVIYGTAPAGLRNPIADMMQRQLAGRLRCLPGIDTCWTLSWAPDVAAGLRLLRQCGAVGENYLLGGPVTTLRDVFVWVSERAGCAVPRRVPLWPFLVLGRTAELLARLSRAQSPPRLSAAALRFLAQSWAFSSQKAKDLGYQTTSLEQGLLHLWQDLHARELVTHAPPAAVPAA